MVRFMDRHFASRVTVLALCLVAGAGTALAQARPPVPPSPGATTAATETITAGLLEASVKKVDPSTGSIQVSTGPIGTLWKTLEVTPDTQIQVEGRQASLADLQEGARIKAAYEAREGKNVATEITVIPTQPGDARHPSSVPKSQ